MPIATFQKRRRSLKLFSDFNNLQFAGGMGIVIFVALVFFMTAPRPHGNGGLDVPRVFHPISVPGANREDAIKVFITRDGQIYMGVDRVSLAEVSEKIKGHLKDPEVERKVYIVADMRARWGGVKRVLQGVQDAGIVRVAFLADERHLH